jgi:hypothetical protein
LGHGVCAPRPKHSWGNLKDHHFSARFARLGGGYREWQLRID